jgi:hypothetical protein
MNIKTGKYKFAVSSIQKKCTESIKFIGFSVSGNSFKKFFLLAYIYGTGDSL